MSTVDNPTPDTNSQILPQIKALINTAFSFAQSNPDKCIELSNQALDIAREAGFSTGIGVSLMHIGIGMYHNDELDNAMKYYEQALQILIPLNEAKLIQNIKNNQGLIYSRWNNVAAEIRCYQEALKHIDQHRDSQNYIFTMNNLGCAFQTLKNYQDALETYRKIFALSIKIGFHQGASKIAHNKGLLYLEQNKFPLAEKWLQKALQIKTDNADLCSAVPTYCALAELYLKTDKLQLCYTNLQFALKQVKKCPSKNELTIVYHDLAMYYQLVDKPSQELKYLLAALEIAETNNLKNQLLSLYPNAIIAYKKRNKPAVALELMEKLLLLQIEADHKAAQTAMTEVLYKQRIEQQQQENEALKKEFLVKENQNRIIRTQKRKLEQAQKELLMLNQHLEGRIAQSIAKIREQDDLINQKTKMESLGRLASGIAHEVFQPLSVINLSVNNIELYLKKGSALPPVIQNKFERIERNIERISHVINQIRAFSRKHSTEQLTQVSIRDCIKDTLQLLQTNLRKDKIKVNTKFTGNQTCLAHPTKLEQVFTNLIQNAIDACRESQSVPSNITIRSVCVGDRITLQISDNGIGIAEQDLANIYEPFFSTKASGDGIGLGLWITYAHLNEIKATISVQSQQNKGTTFTIEIPLAT